MNRGKRDKRDKKKGEPRFSIPKRVVDILTHNSGKTVIFRLGKSYKKGFKPLLYNLDRRKILDEYSFVEESVGEYMVGVDGGESRDSVEDMEIGQFSDYYVISVSPESFLEYKEGGDILVCRMKEFDLVINTSNEGDILSLVVKSWDSVKSVFTPLKEVISLLSKRERYSDLSRVESYSLLNPVTPLPSLDFPNPPKNVKSVENLENKDYSLFPLHRGTPGILKLGKRTLFYPLSNRGEDCTLYPRVLPSEGKSSNEECSLFSYLSEKTFYIYDILSRESKNLNKLPFLKRRKELCEYYRLWLEKCDFIEIAESVEIIEPLNLSTTLIHSPTLLIAKKTSFRESEMLIYDPNPVIHSLVIPVRGRIGTLYSIPRVSERETFPLSKSCREYISRFPSSSIFSVKWKNDGYTVIGCER